MAVNIPIRWSDNTADLKRNLAEGANQIEATRAGAERLVNTLSGDKLIAAAHRYAAAISEVGGVSKLTTAEQERANVVLQKAIDKYTALGKEAPQALKDLAAATSQATAPTMELAVAVGTFIGSLAAKGIEIGIEKVIEFGKAAFVTADQLVRLSDKTDISLQALQKFQIATDDTGDSLEAVAAAANKLQKNLGAGDSSALAALERLNLNFADLAKLSPEEKFAAIAKALGQVKDQEQLVRDGTDLMGRGFTEIIPTIKRGIDDVKDQTVGMSDSTIRALDEAGDAWTRFWRATKGVVGEAVADVLTLSTSAGRRADDAEAKARDARLKQTADRVAELNARMGAGTFAAPLAIPGVPANLTALNAQWDRQSAAMLKAAQAAIDYQRKLDAVNEKIREATRDVGHLSDAQQQAVLKYKALGLSNDEIATKLKVSALAVTAFVDGLKSMRDQLDRIEGPASQFQLKTLSIDDALKQIGTHLPLPPIMSDDDVRKMFQIEHGLLGIGDAVEEMGRQVKPTMNDIGQGLKKVKEPTDALGLAFEQLGRQIGGAMGDAISQIGFFIVKFKAAKTEADKVASAIQGGLAAAGMFTTPGSRGSNVLNYAGQGASLGTAILPGYGTAVGAGVGALVGALKVPEDEKNARDAFNAFKRQVAQMFDAVASGQQRMQAGGDAWAKMVVQVTKAYEETGRSAAQAMTDLETATRHTREDVEKLPDDLAKINQVLQEQQQDATDLQAAIEKYGFTIEELGPAFQKQQLTKQALQLENEFRLLVGAGADATLVLDRMGDGINQFVQTAMKTGTEIPAEMRPMLEKMIEMGKLTDASGNAITDLNDAGLTFSETMTQGFDRVVTALEKVLKQLGYIDTAVDHIPNEKTIKINADWQGLDQGPTATDTPAFASGSGGIRDFGIGTLAVLHGREAVMTEAQLGIQQPYVQGPSTGTATPIDQPITVNVYHTTMMDGAVVEQSVTTRQQNRQMREATARSNALTALGLI